MDATLQRDLVWMTVLLLLPAVFAVGLLFFRRGSEEYMRWWALMGAAGTLGVALSIQTLYDAQVLDRLGVRQDRAFRERASLGHRVGQLELDSPAQAPWADPSTNPARSDDWVARVPWLPRFNISYFIGIDGISIALLVVTAAGFFLALLASWSMTTFVRGYLCLLLVLESALLGAFLALDFFLFHICWVLALVPCYLLIGLWGSGPERTTAALRYFLAGFGGSVLVLLALVGVSFTNVRDFVHPSVVEAAVRQMAEADPSSDEMPRKLERARERVVIRTFDLPTLARAGRAALLKLHGEPVTQVPALTVRRDVLADAKVTNPDAVPALQADLEAAEKGLRERLNQEPFFQGWYQTTLFLLLFLGFGMLLPLVPFHSGFVAALVEAPTPVAMVLCGLLPALGGYGLLRVAYPLCPWAAEQMTPWIGLLGVIGIVYGAVLALGQEDFKKRIAYTVISQMGYVLLGLSAWATSDRAASWAWGANGALFILLAQALTSGGLIYVAGLVTERTKHRRLDLLGGLGEPMPVTSGFSALLFFAALGVPGLCGFVGLFMVLVGAWNYSAWYAGIALATTLVTAGCLLGTFQQVFLGSNPRYKNVTDATPLEILVGIGLVVLCLLLGLWPNFFLEASEVAVTGLIDTLVRLPSPPG